MIPWEAPENRPSVTRATCFPRPAPTKAAPGLNISGIPGLGTREVNKKKGYNYNYVRKVRCLWLKILRDWGGGGGGGSWA